MRKLTLNEYKQEEEAWLNRNGEYFRKLIDINQNEEQIIDDVFNGNVDAYFESDEAKKFEEQRLLLKNEYKGYIDHYRDPDFYCVLKTEDDIDLMVEGDNTKKWMKESIADIGKIMTNGHNSIGKYIGIAVAIDDYYYILYDESSKNYSWCTCCGKIVPYKKECSFKIVENGKDYI